MTDFDEAMKTNDAREYYAIFEIPTKLYQILVENLENWTINFVVGLGDWTIKDIFDSSDIFNLSLKTLAYIMMLRFIIVL